VRILCVINQTDHSQPFCVIGKAQSNWTRKISFFLVTKLQISCRTGCGKTLLTERHGFSRAVKKPYALRSFTGCGKTHALYQATTLVGP
jgi:hypothetical protein